MVGLLAGAAKGLMKKPQKINPDKFAGKMEETKAASQPKGGIVPFQKDSLSIVKVVDIKPKEPKVKAKGGPLAEIQETVHLIVIALKGEEDAKRKRIQEKNKKNQKKKRLNLEALSELGKTTSKVAGGLASATGITSLWGAIWKTLGLLFAGWLTNFIPQIVDFVTKFINITKKVIDVAKPIVKFIWDIMVWVTDKGVKLLALVGGIKPDEASSNSIIKNLTELQKKFPLLEAAFAFYALLKFKRALEGPDGPEGQKAKRRRHRFRHGSGNRTGAEYQAEVKRRHNNLKKIRRNKILNKLRKAVGIEEVDIRPQLDTEVIKGTKNLETPTPKKPGIFDRIKNKVSEVTEVTPDKPTTPPKTRGNFLGIDWGKRATQVSEGFQGGMRKVADAGDFLYKNTIGKLDEQLKKLDPGTILKNLAKGDGPIAAGAKRMLGVFDSPLARKILNKAPFIGDAVVFLLDLATGKHWVRALLRTIGAIGVDAGFYGLLGMTSIAAPFTAGSSLILSAALLAAYMAADAMAGAALGSEGVGQFLGDFVADWLGVPKMAGEKGSGKWESLFGSGGAISNSASSIAKSIKSITLTDKEKEAIAKVPGGLGDPDALSTDDTSSSESSSEIKPNGTSGESKSKDATLISQSASYDDKAGKSTIIPVPIDEMQGGSNVTVKTTVTSGDGVNKYDAVAESKKTMVLSKMYS